MSMWPCKVLGENLYTASDVSGCMTFLNVWFILKALFHSWTWLIVLAFLPELLIIVLVERTTIPTSSDFKSKKDQRYKECYLGVWFGGWRLG